MDIVCSKCESSLDSRRIKLGLKECIECSDTQRYSGHVVYPHKTGAYVQPVSQEQSNNLKKLDRRSTGSSRVAKGIFADNSWDRWLNNYYDNIYNKTKPKKAILTNLHSDLDYKTLKNWLPKNVIPAYDGLTLKL